MTGTVRERDGRWEYRFDAGRDPITGRRSRPGRSGFATREEAEAALQHAEATHTAARRRGRTTSAAQTVLDPVAE